MTTNALTPQLLAWVAARPRTYRETMEAWRTTCPRLTIWKTPSPTGWCPSKALSRCGRRRRRHGARAGAPPCHRRAGLVACERPRGRCAPARRTADRDETGYIVAMENAPDLALSPSERRTLQHLSEGELHASELDWVALQRLKKHGLAEDRAAGLGITKEGRRVLRRLMTTA